MARDFNREWQEVWKIAWGQAFHWLPEGPDRAVRCEFADYAVRKAELLARQEFRDGADAGELTRRAITRARHEARRRMPLHPRFSKWLWQLTAEQRRDVLLEYELGDADLRRAAKPVGNFLGISEADAHRRLKDAFEALRTIIRDDGEEPDLWLGPL